jgi:hypothetical protein
MRSVAMDRRRSVLRFIVGLTLGLVLVFALVYLFTEKWGA